MIVRELMTAPPITVKAGTTVKQALALLDEYEITMLPVVTRTGEVRGVVSEADLIRELVQPDAPVTPRRVGDLMSRHPVTVGPETELVVAVELTTSTGVKSVPVVDEDGHLVGVLSRRDVVHMLARSDDVLEREVDASLVSTGFRDWLVDVRDGVARISGPVDRRERALARVAAGVVPGIVRVVVD